MFAGWHDRSKRLSVLANGKVVTEQIAWELDELVKIYRELVPQYVVEIGTHYGGTLWHWLENAAACANLVTIDLGPQLWRPPEPAFNPAIWNDWLPQNISMLNIWGNSHDEAVKRQVLDFIPYIDFLFIDSDHSYEGARLDWEMYGPMVKKGSGVVAFHDILTPETSPHIQVWQLWREIQAAGYRTQELLASGNAPWGGIGVVYV
jgi:cephalosporin hydroxylase